VSHDEQPKHRWWLRTPLWLGVCLLASITLFVLWEQHRIHILGALAWLLLLACPFIHFFMHRNHGHGGGQGHGRARRERGERGAS